MKQHKIVVTDIILLVLGALFLIGLLTFLKPCGPKDDGSWMICHWAGNAAAGVAGALLALAVVRLFVSAKVKLGLDITAIVLSVLSICIPGHLIGLCMMADMRCRAVMAPGVTVLSVLTVIAAAADILMQRKKA